ncbi:hypothetical protein ASG87_06375 [Frateuria sp. Soil773]|uniref:RnfH family protein n=1 Tax=Frateuria sp. Soil773 TaxID=1736407 RepID=UPI0006FDB9DC|nr:RnfH family protein [Frateuria sp. Soil773]KRE89156.1 hypothetical protein ASG87_06375 [Frateuria sp. Soil773]
MDEPLAVEVVLALPDRQLLRRVTLPAGATVADAIAASGLAHDCPGLVDPDRAGIFSRRVTPQQAVRTGDRIELYRPLALDPKEARRRRAGG